MNLLLPKYKRNLLPIYYHIPELKLMNRKLSYQEIYDSLSILADTQLVFINKFKINSDMSLTCGIIYFPYTPNILDCVNCPVNLIKNLGSYLKLSCK